MSWQGCPAAAWLQWVAAQRETLTDPRLRETLSKFCLLPSGLAPEELSAAVHEGDLLVDGDFTPLAHVTAIHGDLIVSGKLSTEEVDGLDGNATLIVFGNLRCGALVNDWASILFVTGNCDVREWAFAAREDSSFLVGGDFRTPIFLGSDIWVSVGGEIRMDYGYGYGVSLDHFDDAWGAAQVHPERGWRELALRLAVPVTAGMEEHGLLEALEKRLYETGTLLPSR